MVRLSVNVGLGATHYLVMFMFYVLLVMFHHLRCSNSA